MGKLLESETLKQQAANNTKEQFAYSPDSINELLNAIIAALNIHTTMNSQALDSERPRCSQKRPTWAGATIRSLAGASTSGGLGRNDCSEAAECATQHIILTDDQVLPTPIRRTCA